MSDVPGGRIEEREWENMEKKKMSYLSFQICIFLVELTMTPVDLVAMAKEASMRWGVAIAKAKTTRAEAKAESEADDGELEEKIDGEEEEELVVLPWERPIWMEMEPILMNVIFGIIRSNLVSFCLSNENKWHHY